MSRKKSREYVFRTVFEKFFHEPDIEFEDEEFVFGEEDKSFANSLSTGINDHYDELINIITTNTEGYELDRIFKVDLAILVLAVYELKFTDTPKNIVINEAVELSKKYSTDKSYSFINGVLAKVVK
jgi:N utilization substance protein B